ncbi:MAG: superoxide dismutase [Burkholderiales bacterium]|jgi:Fe-Mn family superoxide dismutase
MPTYVLPDLDYDFGALEPHISGEVMELHHSGHHKGYVEKANETLEKLDEARAKQDFTRISAFEKALAFNLSGHVLHSVFWKNLVPKGGGEPRGELGRLIARDFGGFEPFKAQLTKVAGTIMGSGWATLVWEPLARRLLTCQVYDHQSNLSQGGVVLMVIDAWEHAYYLQYRNQKLAFFDAVWNLWNWDDVNVRLESARRLDLQVPDSVGTGAGAGL